MSLGLRGAILSSLSTLLLAGKVVSRRPPAGQRLAMKRHRGEAIASARYQEVYGNNSKTTAAASQGRRGS